MSDKAFSKIVRGLKEARAYLKGERQGYQMTVPSRVGGKSIRKVAVRRKA